MIRPLQQVINRYNEKYNNSNLRENQQLIQKPILKNMHDSGPLIDHVSGCQYYTLLLKSVKIKVKEDRDSFILTKHKEIVKCLNFCQSGADIFIIGQKFKILIPLYEEPIDSTLLEIFEVKKLSKTLKCWSVFDLKKKL